jgi:phage repressor protein C with HTH and peptisase S24 domain
MKKTEYFPGFGERLAVQLKRQKLTNKEFAEQVKINANSLTNYTAGRRVPGPDILQRMADILHVSVEWLLHGEKHNDDPDIIDLGDERRIPVFDAGAGFDCFWDDNGYPVGHSNTYVTVSKREIDERAFGLKVHGDSMLPKIESGDMVIVVPGQRLENGCICFVTDSQDNQGEKLIRRYHVDSKGYVMLVPDNPAAGFSIAITPENQERYKIFRVTEVRKKV